MVWKLMFEKQLLQTSVTRAWPWNHLRSFKSTDLIVGCGQASGVATTHQVILIGSQGWDLPIWK